jgi:hypothetical protein
VLPPLELLPPDYPAHLGALVRRAEEQPNGTVRTGYVKTGADDYAHSEVYLHCAFWLLWRRAGHQLLAELQAIPVPMLEPGDMLTGEAVYRPGFEDDSVGDDVWAYLP